MHCNCSNVFQLPCLCLQRLQIKFNQAARVCFTVPAALIGYKIGLYCTNFLAQTVQQYSRTYISKCRDVCLDPHDYLDYIKKGGVYDREAQNLLRSLEDGLRDEAGLQNGTIVIPPPLRDAMKCATDALRLRCAKSRRVGYITELSTVFPLLCDCSEKASTDLEEKEVSSGFPTAIDSSGKLLNMSEIVFQSLLLCEARLADAELRVIRDALLDTIRYLNDTLKLWINRHGREVKFLRLKDTCKALFNVLFHRKGSDLGQHVLFEVNELPSSKCIALLELLLRRSVRRLSLLQNHLQGLPNISRHKGGELGEGVIDTTLVCALEHWISDAVSLITKTLNQERTFWDTEAYFSGANIESGVEILKPKTNDLIPPVGICNFCDMLYPSKTLRLVYHCGWNYNELKEGCGKGENRAYGPQEWLSHIVKVVKEEQERCCCRRTLLQGRCRMRDGLHLCKAKSQVALLHKSQRSRVEVVLRKGGAMHETQKAWLIRNTMFPVMWMGLISIGGKLAYNKREEVLRLGSFKILN